MKSKRNVLVAVLLAAVLFVGCFIGIRLPLKEEKAVAFSDLSAENGKIYYFADNGDPTLDATLLSSLKPSFYYQRMFTTLKLYDLINGGMRTLFESHDHYDFSGEEYTNPEEFLDGSNSWVIFDIMYLMPDSTSFISLLREIKICGYKIMVIGSFEESDLQDPDSVYLIDYFYTRFPYDEVYVRSFLNEVESRNKGFDNWDLLLDPSFLVNYPYINFGTEKTNLWTVYSRSWVVRYIAHRLSKMFGEFNEHSWSIFANHNINIYFYLSGTTVMKLDESENEVVSYDSGSDFYGTEIDPRCLEENLDDQTELKWLYVLGYCPLPADMYSFVYDIQFKYDPARDRYDMRYNIDIYLIQIDGFFYGPEGLLVIFCSADLDACLEREGQLEDILAALSN